MYTMLNKKYLSVKEAAEYLRMSEIMLKKLISAKKGPEYFRRPSLKREGSRLYTEELLDSWLIRSVNEGDQ